MFSKPKNQIEYNGSRLCGVPTGQKRSFWTGKMERSDILANVSVYAMLRSNLGWGSARAEPHIRCYVSRV